MTSLSSKSSDQGRLIGVGVGPGDPELLTLKALRLIQNAPYVSYLANEEGVSQAKNIAVEAFQHASAEQQHLPIKITMSTDRKLINQAYDAGAKEIGQALKTGQDVVFLCEGDPLFFASFSYVLERLQGGFSCQIVPGISSLHAASAALVAPLTIQKESLAVVTARHTDAQIMAALQQNDTVVIMKVGRERGRIVELLREAGRFHQGRYLEYIGRPNERIINDLNELELDSGAYFSLFVIDSAERDVFA